MASNFNKAQSRSAQIVRSIVPGRVRVDSWPGRVANVWRSQSSCSSALCPNYARFMFISEFTNLHASEHPAAPHPVPIPLAKPESTVRWLNLPYTNFHFKTSTLRKSQFKILHFEFSIYWPLKWFRHLKVFRKSLITFFAAYFLALFKKITKSSILVIAPVSTFFGN